MQRQVKMKLTIIALLTIFLTSCKNQKFICSEIKGNRIDPVVMYDVSFVFNRCRARCFDPNEWKTIDSNLCPSMPQGEIVEEFLDGEFLNSINLPIEECEGMAGFKIEPIAREIRPKIKRLNEIYVDNCK